MSKCVKCGNEILTGDIHWEMGLCNNCYNELYKDHKTHISLDKMWLKLAQDFRDENEKLQDKISDLEAKLAECKKQIKDAREAGNMAVDSWCKNRRKYEAQIAEMQNKSFILYSMLYETLEKQGCDNVASQIDQMTGWTYDKEADWLKGNRNYDQLKQQLAEKEEQLKEELIEKKGLERALSACNRQNDEFADMIKKLVKDKEELKQQLAEKEKSLSIKSVVRTLMKDNNLNCTFRDKTNAQIQQCGDVYNSNYGYFNFEDDYDESLNNKNDNRFDITSIDLTNQDKISFAVEQLEHTKKRIYNLRYYENKCLNKKDCIEDCLEELDHQIEEIKKEMK